MKLSKLIGRRTKEVPREAASVSHQYLLRGGYVRPVASGIYSILPLAKRVLAKIENIIRQENRAMKQMGINVAFSGSNFIRNSVFESWKKKQPRLAHRRRR